jgi:hypothetical protein
LLEQFFESSFPASFRISDKLVPTNPASSSTSLTTFSNLGFNRNTALSTGGGVGGTGSAGLVPPGKGLRGVLDNIVTDGMRVAAEVRRRMDEAQKEMEKNAVGRPDDDDEDDEGYESRTSGAYGGDAERRSVRSEDRDLLEGADAEAGSIKGQEFKMKNLPLTPLSPDTSVAARTRSISMATQKVVEFER